MRYLRQNTATTITIGPFVSPSDGVTPVTSLTPTSETATMVVDNVGGSPALALNTTLTASGGSNDLVHVSSDTAGYFTLELTAANTNYVGGALLSINLTATHAPVFHEFVILPANVYDSLVPGTDLLDVSLVQVAGSTTSVSTIATSVASILSDTGTDGVVISAATQTSIADTLLNRDMSAVSDTNARSPLNALRFLRNKWSISGTTLTVTEEDDTTSAWTATLTATQGADPVTAVDPA